MKITPNTSIKKLIARYPDVVAVFEWYEIELVSEDLDLNIDSIADIWNVPLNELINNIINAIDTGIFLDDDFVDDDDDDDFVDDDFVDDDDKDFDDDKDDDYNFEEDNFEEDY
jgi:hypothetical protein